MDIPTQVYIQPIFNAVHIHLLILEAAYTCVYVMPQIYHSTVIRQWNLAGQ